MKERTQTKTSPSPTGFRPTPKLRRFLEIEAERNERSLSREIESRLEASFVREDTIREFGAK